MTSLKQSVWKGLRKDYPWADAEIKKTLDSCIDGCIRELEEYMIQNEPSREWSKSSFWEGYACGKRTALKFLKEET